MGCELCKVNGQQSHRELRANRKDVAAKLNGTSTESTKQYSWDKRDKPNPKDYTLENLKEELCVKHPGTVNGQQLIIQNCESSQICILDHINTVTVDDCKNCSFIIGPTKGSVFLRDCQQCNFVVACQQFRTRDCKQINIFLSCATQPIIEASYAMKFACYRLFYPDLEDHFRKAGLSVFNNNWNSVHDFTASNMQSNWKILPENVKLEDNLTFPKLEDIDSVTLSLEPTDSIVPYTFGSGSRTSEESAIVVFFSDGHSHERARSYISTMRKNHPNLRLLASKEMCMTSSDAQRVLLTSSYSAVVERGKVIGLDYNGPDCIQACQNTAMLIATSTGSTGHVYVSGNRKNAVVQIEKFFGFCDIHMPS